MAPEPLLSVRDLHTAFPIRSPLLRRRVGTVQAVAGVSFDLAPGEKGVGHSLHRLGRGDADPDPGQRRGGHAGHAAEPAQHRRQSLPPARATARRRGCAGLRGLGIRQHPPRMGQLF